MNAPLSLSAALAATAISALIVFATRAFPFVLFSYREPPRVIRFVEKYIPPMVIAILVVYCFKDVRIAAKPWGIPSFCATGATVLLHLWKRNPMISIFGGTALFMVLSRVL
ncbi:MAG: AzlD domain-containing protein [Treponema sp.]|nr:AzlD domain-containing protein [Treponema sp.]